MSRVKHPVVPLLVSVVALLGISVVLQGILVWKVLHSSPQSASVESQLLPGSQQPPSGRQRPVPVVITNAGDIDVNVRNHYIVNGDPIPVKIVRER